MKNILITTNHPANYMDILFNNLSKTYNLTVLYNKKKSNEKLWKKQDFFPSDIIKDKSFYELFTIFKKQDFIILGGWNGKVNFTLIMFFFIFKKNFAVFTDVPDYKDINPLKKVLKKVFFKMIPHIFVTGKSGQSHFIKNYNLEQKKLKLFPYTIDLPNYEIVKDKVIKIKPNSKLNIFIANRFIDRKGYSIVYNAFKKLDEKKMLNKFKINIAGTGPQFDEYKKKFNLLSKEINMLGWIEVDDYNQYVQDMDIFIHASTFEPYGIPVLDAMANGKIIIASDGVMSGVDYINNNINGFLFEKNDSNGLFNILDNIIKSPDNLTKIRLNALDTSRKFTTDVHENSINTSI